MYLTNIKNFRFNSKRGRMSMRDFIRNTSSEKYHFDEGHLKNLYKIIRKNPLMKASSSSQLLVLTKFDFQSNLNTRKYIYRHFSDLLKIVHFLFLFIF